MNAVLSVFGKDNVGILAKVSTECANYHANILEVSQTIISGNFSMFMVIDIDTIKGNFTELVDAMTSLGKNLNLDIHVMHEDIFNLMHKI